MISVGIIGGSGYTGKKLVQFCSQHLFVDNFEVYGFTKAGETLYGLFPELMNAVSNKVVNSIEDLSYEHDLYFIALPHGEALKFVPQLIENVKKVIDLGGDYRLNNEALYFEWYKKEHTSAELLINKTYGLADFYNSSDYNSNLIANPGCYPTSILLALLPFAKYYSNEILSVSSVSYSGTSGAGKSANQDLLLSEMDGNVKAYNVNSHRHQPEILQELKKNGFKSPFSFTTHLLPAAVGIYSTTVVHLVNELNENEITSLYSVVYKDSHFVRLRNTPPELKWVTGTNFCDINISIKGNCAVITSAIDNLIKGAAGQAIQNMNKIFGWDETAGILVKGGKNVQVY